jgi:peptide/nickel transport system substrate-binding protein
MTMKSILFVFLSVILVVSLILSGCAQSPSATTAAPPSTSAAKPASATVLPPTSAAAPTSAQPAKPAAGAPEMGGTLKIITSPGVSNLGYPGKAYISGNTGLGRPAVEFLINFDPTGAAAIVPELGTTWQYSPDYKTLTFTLRKGVKFQDGTDFNAAAAKWNLDLQRAGWRSELRSITSVDVVDDYTVRLNLLAYDSVLLVALGGMAGAICSPTAVQKMGDASQLNPVGTGPFKFVSYQTDTSLKFARWDGYWQKGKPYLDNIEYVIIKDPVTSLASFNAKEAQYIRSVTTRDALDLQKKANVVVQKYPSVVTGIAGDSAHPDSPFANIKVRRAIAYAIDNAAIAKAVGNGFYEATNQFANPNGAWGAVYNPAVVGYPFSPDKAKQQLTEAGFPTGFETTLTYNATVPDQQSMCLAIQSYLNAVGIKVKLDAADPGRFAQVTATGWKNQLVFFRTACAGGLNAAQAYRSSMNSKATSWDPKSILIPADFDTLYWQLAVEPDPKKARDLSQQLSKMATDDYCLAIPVYVEQGIFAYYNNLRDMDMYKYATAEWTPENAWLSK